MSQAETMKFVKQREFWLSREIALQIKKDSLDGISNAGETGKSVNAILEAFPTKRKSVPTQFEEFAGDLFAKAKEESHNARVSRESLIAIADKIDRSLFVPPLEYLEKSSREQVADHNRRVGTDKALTTWRKLASNPSHQEAMRRRLSHAAQKLRRNSYAQ